MKIYCFVLIALGLAMNSFGQTQVSGGIYQNTTWNIAGSPYIVNGSVVVFPGNTLNIEPGVEILINNQSNNTIYIETRGSLNCVGTNQLPIKIRTLYDTTNVGWQGFKCISSQGGILTANKFHISNADIPFFYEAPLGLIEYSNCKFSHCNQAITVGNTLILDNCQFVNNTNAIYGWSYFTLNNCFFEGNDTAINAYSTSFVIANSDFVDNQIGLTFSSGVFDTMLVSNCNFSNNGVALNSPNNGKIENCYFSDNTFGIQYAYGCEVLNNQFINNELGIEASVLANVHDNQINQNIGGILISGVSNVADSPIIYNNAICGNINYNVNNNTNMNYSLLENCFCGLDSAAIEEYLIDGYDDITKGLINYQVYDSSCSTILLTVLKYNANTLNLNAASLDFSITNPVENTLIFFGDKPVFAVEIIDLFGKKYLFTAEEPNHFDLSGLAPGYYFISQVNNQSMRKSFIKL